MSKLLTPEVLKQLRSHTAILRFLGGVTLAMYGRNIDPSKEWTCDECEARLVCDTSYDIYNTDGDCIQEK